jgi:SulP family sulfate permease
MLALVFFGVLHVFHTLTPQVPINVPSLSYSTNQAVDLNHELIMHGISNVLAGLAGSCQNYLVYTNSVLFYRCGGNSRTAGLMLSVALIVVFLFGSCIIELIPSILVGSLIFHLAFELLKEVARSF